MLFSHFTTSNFLKELQNLERYTDMPYYFVVKWFVYDKVFNYSHLSYAKVIPANPDSHKAYI